jgi:hypothetical protein
MASWFRDAVPKVVWMGASCGNTVLRMTILPAIKHILFWPLMVGVFYLLMFVFGGYGTKRGD